MRADQIRQRTRGRVIRSRQASPDPPGNAWLIPIAALVVLVALDLLLG